MLRKAAAAAGKSKLKSRPVAKAKLLAPVLWPSAIYCAGANYNDHMEEMAKLQGMPPSPDPHEIGLEAVALHQGVAHRDRRQGDREAADGLARRSTGRPNSAP